MHLTLTSKINCLFYFVNVLHFHPGPYKIYIAFPIYKWVPGQTTIKWYLDLVEWWDCWRLKYLSSFVLFHTKILFLVFFLSNKRWSWTGYPAISNTGFQIFNSITGQIQDRWKLAGYQTLNRISATSPVKSCVL